ncbi:hypothetical protein ACFLWJ_00405 [Chloroflexota bacterium]
MLKWFLISFGVIIALVVALVGTLYYLVFYKEVALTRPITYESEEQALASGISGILDSLLGIELTTDQEADLDEIIAGFAAGTHTIDDLTGFITDPETGVMFTNAMHLTGERSLQLNETQLTALFNFIIGNLGSFDIDMDGVSSEDGKLSYTVTTDAYGDLTAGLSGIGMNINETDMEMVFTLTLPENIPYVGFLFGGKTISIGLNPLIDAEDDGTVNIDFNLTGVKVGGISGSWPGVSHLINYLESSFLGDASLTQSLNLTGPLNNIFGGDIGLSLTVVEGQIAFVGPPGYEGDIFDFTEEERAALIASAEAAIGAFTPGDTLELSEEELTALMAATMEEAFAGGDTDLGIDFDSLSVNVDENGELVLTTTVDAGGGDTGLPEGSEAEVDIITEVVIDDEGNAVLVITDVEMGGLSAGELGLDVDDMNASLEDSGMDLAEALGLPPGSLSGAETDAEGNLILT